MRTSLTTRGPVLSIATAGILLAGMTGCKSGCFLTSFYSRPVVVSEGTCNCEVHRGGVPSMTPNVPHESLMGGQGLSQPMPEISTGEIPPMSAPPLQPIPETVDGLSWPAQPPVDVTPIPEELDLPPGEPVEL
ncbi:hypothetical protein [Crateriforma spongiae]|uniref:hypothetical protein n=1 Tax=Crateriforma spongiae TaxID=2724528 RepID=UPI001447070D|nr:hypothetical protein [Crateriforma spongiae]